MPEKFSLTEASELLGRSFRALLSDVQRGRLKAKKEGNKWLIDEGALREFRAEHQNGGYSDAQLLSEASDLECSPEFIHYVVQMWVHKFWDWNEVSQIEIGLYNGLHSICFSPEFFF